MNALLAALRAVAEPTRLRLFALCAGGEWTVSELVGILRQSQPRVSRHLKLLTDAEKPVLLNGSNGNRIWGLWSLYLGARWGIPVDRTKEVAKALRNGHVLQWAQVRLADVEE